MSKEYKLNDFTTSQFSASSLTALADSWINILDVQGIGVPDVLTLTVEFVTPVTDGRTRWMKTVVVVSRDDYMFHEGAIIDKLINTVDEAREQIKAAQRG